MKIDIDAAVVSFFSTLLISVIVGVLIMVGIGIYENYGVVGCFIAGTFALLIGTVFIMLYKDLAE